jgi:hypothetical protein
VVNTDPMPYTHAGWCDDRDRLTAHAFCSALLGAVDLGHIRMLVRVVRPIDTPVMLTLTITNQTADEVLPLNAERAHQLEKLIRAAIKLLSSPS